MLKAVLLAAVSLTLLTAGQKDAPFLLAVLNRDGLAQPFAAFDGRRWKAPWPDHRQIDLPISIESVDRNWWGTGAPPGRMTLWAYGAKLGEAAITGLTQIRGLCSARLGVRTDYKSKAIVPPRMKQPYPKEGLLVSGDVPIGRIDIVQRDSEEWNQALVSMTDDFNKAETRAIAMFGGWRHPIQEKLRRRQPITLEAVYKAPSDAAGWTTYFVEAVRQYPPIGPGDDCGLTTTGQGWVHVGPAGKKEIELLSRVTYCDRKGVNVMLPFGTVRAANRTYWVFQFSGYEDEWYQVVRPEPNDIDVAVTFHAGSCPE